MGIEYPVYGNPWAADGLYNLRIGYYGIQASYRFIAHKFANVNRLQYFNAYSLTKPGYHSGNGGQIKIDIQSDNNGTPSGTILATALIANPLNHPAQLGLLFDKTVALQAGSIYHIVFSNIDQDPEINHVSINMMYCVAPKIPGSPDNPELQPLDMAVLWRDKTNKTWRKFKETLSTTPIFTLYHSQDQINIITVPGYGGMESWIAEPRKIIDNNAVRQKFIPNKDINVRNVSIRIGKVGSPPPLRIALSDYKKEYAVGHISSDLIQTANANHTNYNWVTADFDKPAVLYSGTTYYLTASSTNSPLTNKKKKKLKKETNTNNTGFYEVFPIRDGSTFGYSPLWANSNAEYTIHSDSGWRGWDAWGNQNLTLSDLQLYFNAST